MDLTKVSLMLTKYKLKSLDIKIGAKTVRSVPSDNFMNFTIVEDYDKYCFPYFEISIVVSNATYRLMTKNPSKLKVTLDLQKGNFDAALAIDSGTNVTFKKAIKQTFFAILPDTSPDITEETQDTVEKSDNQYAQLTTTKLLLYPDDYYKKYNLVVNGILANVKLIDIVTYLLNKAGIKKVLLSPPAKSKKFSQFIITPIPLTEQLSRICKKYALHTKGSVVYFGLNRLYIIDKIAKCTAWENNEYKTVYVVNSTSSNSNVSSVSGGCTNKTDKFHLINASGISSTSNTEQVKKIAGSNVVTVTGSGSITKTSKNLKKVTKVVINDEGVNTTKALKHSITESKKTINAEFSNIDITNITPNKQYVLTFDSARYKKYSGKYRLSKISHVFAKEGEYYSVSSSAVFKG